MFNDTITLPWDTINQTFTRRSPKGNRSVFVISGDSPSDERRVEIAHEVTSGRRVNSLVKFARSRPNPTTNLVEEASVQVKIVHPATFTDADMGRLNELCVGFLSSSGFFAKLYNQEQ